MGRKRNAPAVTPVLEVAADGEAPGRRPSPQAEPLPTNIWAPKPGQDVQARLTPTTNYISAAGERLEQGKAAKVVWAKVYQDLYDQTYIAKNIPRPDAGALSYVPDLTAGKWYFAPMAGSQELPGVAIDLDPQGLPNNTLVVWYDFDPTAPYLIESVQFHAYGVLSSCGGGACSLLKLSAPPAGA
jgi:hypothetical protein